MLPGWLLRMRKPRADEMSDERDVEDPKESKSHFDFQLSILTTFGAKGALVRSRIVRVDYRRIWKWGLLAFLAFIAVFLTPSLLPQWLGFKWSTTKDLCRSPGPKLNVLREKMATLSREIQGKLFEQQILLAVTCMNDSASDSWNGKGRVQHPAQCVPANARAKTRTRQVCVGGQQVKKCVRFLGIKFACGEAGLKRRCHTVVTRDDGAVRRVAEIGADRERERKAVVNAATGNATDGEEKVRVLLDTADESGEALVSRLVLQVDVASNLFLIYTFLAVLIGTPVVICKRELSSGIVSFLLSMNKASFVLAVVAVWTLYDTGLQLMFDVDFPRLIRNFRADPCYLDPSFSKDRLALIGETCANVTQQRVAVNRLLTNMTDIYYRAALCEVCGTDNPKVPPHANSTLIIALANERKMYLEGDAPGYTFPASCNATALNEATSTPPEDGTHWFKAVLSSGILAQILLKGVLTMFATHLVGYIEPMALHGGKVEVFGMKGEKVDSGKNRKSNETAESLNKEEWRAESVGSQGATCENSENRERSECSENGESSRNVENGASVATLNERDSRAVCSFVRGKHLIPLGVASILLALEIAIVAYSIVVGRNDSSIAAAESVPFNSTVNLPPMQCISGRLKNVTSSSSL